MVEQSMKRRSGDVGERGGLRMGWKTFLTWDGPGRTVRMVVCKGEYKSLARAFKRCLSIERKDTDSNRFRGLALM